MKKKLSILIIASLFFTINVHAYTYKDYENDKICGNFEVSDATDTGKLNEVGCYSNFAAAKSAVDSSTSERRVVLTKVNNKVKIVYAKYGIVDFSYNPNQLSYLYEKSDLSTRKYTYINTLDTSMTIDGALADVVYVPAKSIYSAKVKIAGFTGWMNANDLEIVPLPWVKATSSYTVSTTIKHNYVNRPQFAYSGSAGSVIGPKPTMLAQGKYYSYDGHYFYTSLKSMLTDYKANTYSHSVNANNPYYNYYMYLSNHTKTNYSAINIDEYIRRSYSKDVYGKAASSGTSRLYGKGTFFYNSQQVNGVNAILSYSLSRNETGNGTSSLAINKNNGFGLNAVDSNPYQAANWYASFASSIMGYSSEWVTNKYAKATHSLYFGPQFGNKAIGMNVKYASDPYWSEKMASNYYYFDNANGLQDYNYYQLGIVKSSCAAKQSASDSAKTIYTYPEYEDAVVIVGETKTGNDTWYKVVPDVNLDNNYNIKSSGDFNWNIFVYVKASNITKINTPVSGYKTPNSVFSYKDSAYTYNLMDANNTLKPAVAKITKNADYYYDSTLTQKTGKRVLKDRYVMVYAVAYNSSKTPVAALVTSDYKFDQKHWISSTSLQTVNMAYGLESVTTPQNYYSWVNSTTQDIKSTLISGIYTNAYFPILEAKTVNKELWYKVPVSLDSNTNVYGWTLAKAPDVSITKYNSTVSIPFASNQAPIINAKDLVVSQYSQFNPLNGVTATDVEDGNITSKITIKENTININVLGDYKIIYQVTDSANTTTTKEIKVTVEKDHNPEINLVKNQVELYEELDPKSLITIIDHEDGNLIDKVEVIENNIDINNEGTYKITYKVKDSQNNEVTKSFEVSVVKIPDGWRTKDNKKYYYENSRKVKGFKEIDDKLYYFSEEDESLQTGWQDLSTGRIYSDKNGVVARGWQTIDGKKYYFKKSNPYNAYQYYHDIDGKTYYFYGNYSLRTGWQETSVGKTYSNSDGTVAKGWKTIDGKKYYFNKSYPYQAYQYYHDIDGKTYYFYGNNSLRTGWQETSNGKFYSDKNGVVAKEWQTIDGKKYYFNKSYPYQAYQYYHDIDGKIYYFYGNYSLRTGTQESANGFFYSDKNGVVQTGWQTIDGKKYYFNKSHPYNAYRAYNKIDDKLYYFYYGTYYLRTGWQETSNGKFYSDNNGIVATGWKTINGKIYYFNKSYPYNILTGKQTIDGKTYYFDKYGRLQ